jgi:hypothetical protein
MNYEAFGIITKSTLVTYINTIAKIHYKYDIPMSINQTLYWVGYIMGNLMWMSYLPLKVFMAMPIKYLHIGIT